MRQSDSDEFGVDRVDFARRHGANVATAQTPAELGELVAGWGYRNVGEALEAFNAALAGDRPLDPPREANRRPLTAPFHAIEGQSAITFTHGGVRTDEKARVLDKDGKPIPGLLAAGADVGGTYYMAYAGGLAMSSTAALVAVTTALAEKG